MSTRWGIESGSAQGRGWDSSGLCGLFAAWAQKPQANHGPGWTLIADYTAIPSVNFNPADVNTTNEVISITNNPFPQFCQVTFSSTGTLPTPLIAGSPYWINRLDSSGFFVFDNLGRCMYGNTATNKQNFSTQGTGVHTMTASESFVVFCDTSSPVVNSYNGGPSGLPPKFYRFGFLNTEAGYCRLQAFSWWDTTNKAFQGMWYGQRLADVDSGPFAYDFRGGDQGCFLATRLGASWYYVFVDEWEGIPSLVEPTTKVGVLQSGVVAGNNVVMTLATGQENNFTVNKYYYIYDFRPHQWNYTWVNYGKVVAVDTINHTITFSNVARDFPAGSVVCAYAHRFYGGGNGYYSGGPTNLLNNVWHSGGTGFSIPYCSSAVQNDVASFSPAALNASYASIMLCSHWFYNESILSIGAPDDFGNYYCMRFLIAEQVDANASGTSMNRIYGKSVNHFHTHRSTMAQMLDYRTMYGKNWLNYSASSGAFINVVNHSESAV